ncbi:MAG: AMP-binding protein [Oceanicaulis sp.]
MTAAALAPDLADRLGPIPASLPDFLREAAETHGDAFCCSIVLPNGWSAKLSYAQLDAASDRLSRFLTASGFQRGDVAAIQAPNILSYPVALFGVLKAGGVVTNVNPLYTAHEAARQIRRSQARVLFGFDGFASVLNELYDTVPNLTLITLSASDFFPGLGSRVLDGLLRLTGKVSKVGRPHIRLRDALKRSANVEPPAPLSGEEVCFHQYSGGTTGEPKGALLTGHRLMLNVAQTVAMSPDKLTRPGRRALLVLPLYHMFGLFMCIAAMRTGGETVLIPNPRPLSNLKPAFEKCRPDIVPGVNTLFAGLLEEPWFTKDLAACVELTFSGATALKETVARRWMERTGSVISEAYGMTETTTVLTSTPLDAGYRPGLAGRPLPGVEIRICDEDGQPLAPGERGEVRARGPQLMLGYLGEDGPDISAMPDGWLRTGDIGVMEPDGFLRIVDRLKDMIIVSGFNVYPNEIEETLHAVDGVAEAAVTGAPDNKTGERIVAHVVRSDPGLTREQIIEACEARLTAYKRPKEIRFVESLPKSPVGKVLRRELKDAAP